MGDFFSSPRQRGSESIFDAAMSGKPIGSFLMDKSFRQGNQAIEQGVSNRVSGVSGDILSQLTSMGVAPSSGMVQSVQERAVQPILGQGQQAQSQLAASYSQDLAQLVMQQLGLGLSGLSPNSTFGDIFAGLTTLTNIGTGAFNLYQGISKNQPVKVD